MKEGEGEGEGYSDVMEDALVKMRLDRLVDAMVLHELDIIEKNTKYGRKGARFGVLENPGQRNKVKND
jgi:hypothetical protein